jgi:hypothetical protein
MKTNFPKIDASLDILKEILDEAEHAVHSFQENYDNFANNNNAIVDALTTSQNENSLYNTLKNEEISPVFDYTLIPAVQGSFRIVNATNNNAIKGGASAASDPKLIAGSNISFGVFSESSVFQNGQGFFALCALRFVSFFLATSATNLNLQYRPFASTKHFAWKLENIPNEPNRYYLRHPDGYLGWASKTDTLQVFVSRTDNNVVKWKLEGDIPQALIQ